MGTVESIGIAVGFVASIDVDPDGREGMKTGMRPFCCEVLMYEEIVNKKRDRESQ